MMCYKDMTFCNQERCKDFGAKCHRSLTKEVRLTAKRLQMPIAIFTEAPKCFKPKFKENVQEKKNS